MRRLAPGLQAKRLSSLVVIGCALTASSLGGCSTRIAQDEQARMPSAPMAGEPARRQPVAEPPLETQPNAARQGVGAGPVWMDDPARRRGPQGQPAPYGRDTITGRPLSELPPPGTPGDGAPAPRPAMAGPGGGAMITVSKGDTLYGLARRHNVTVDALMRANNLTPDYKIRAGQSLIIPRR